MGSSPRFSLSRRIQHIFDKNSVPSRRVIYKNVRHGANQFTILNDGTAAHTLDNAAGTAQKLRICNLQQEIPAVGSGFRINFQNFRRIFPGLAFLLNNKTIYFYYYLKKQVLQ